MQIGNMSMIWLSLAIPLTIALALYAANARRQAAQRFASANLHSQLFVSQRWTRGISNILMCAVFALLTLALLDIRWGRAWQEVPQKGIEVVFALDVSRSMLAKDVSPNRLERAKQQISDLLDEMPGDRVGLVTFAGEAEKKLPLTTHFEDFKQVLREIGPHSVGRGGSRLGDAIEVAANAFMEKTHDHKTIVIFTDGEDQESKPLEVARRVHRNQGVRIFTVGLGDLEQGAKIPESNEPASDRFVEYRGEVVWSKLNGKLLSQVATETGGAFIPAGTKQVNMADVYHSYIAKIEQTEFDQARINTYIARYQWFVAPALFCLIFEVFFTTRRTRVPTVSAPWQVLGIVLCLSLMGTASPVAAHSETLPQRLNAANQLVREGDYDGAMRLFEQIAATDKDSPALHYNRGVAFYRQGNIEEARKGFQHAAAAEDSALAASARYNLGNCDYQTGLQVAGEDPTMAIERLRDAITSYRDALRLDPANQDARLNIELAAQMLRQLKQQQEQEQKSQQDQQPPSDEQDPKQEQKEKQTQQQDQNNKDQDENQTEKPEDSAANNSDKEMSEQQQQQEKDSKAGADDAPDKQPEEQQNRNESSEGKPSEPKEPSPDSGAMSQADRQEDQQASNASKKQEDPLSSGSDEAPSQKATDETKTVDETKNADEQPSDGELTATNSEAANESEKEKLPQKVGKDSETIRSMTKEEALKLLQAVRDRDMMRRLRMQQLERSRQVPVERDW